MIFEIELEKYVAIINIFCIIKGKFYYKKLYLIILFKIDKCLKLNFYYAILFLNLAIYLRIEGYS